MNYWEIIADNLSKTGWSLRWGVSPWIAKGEQSGLLTLIALDGENFVVHARNPLQHVIPKQFLVASDGTLSICLL